MAKDKDLYWFWQQFGAMTFVHKMYCFDEGIANI